MINYLSSSRSNRFRFWRPVAMGGSLASLLLASGCSYTNGEKDKETPVPCEINAATVSYAKDIFPIVQKNCLQCHGQQVYANKGGGNNWENFAEFQHEALNGTLVAVLEQKDPAYAAVYMPRPIGSTKLAACDIERIKAWVAKGAPQK